MATDPGPAGADRRPNRALISPTGPGGGAAEPVANPALVGGGAVQPGPTREELRAVGVLHRDLGPGDDPDGIPVPGEPPRRM